MAAFKILILSVLLLAAWGEKQGQKILSCPMHQPWAPASQPIELEKHHDDALCCSAYICIFECLKKRSNEAEIPSYQGMLQD